MKIVFICRDEALIAEAKTAFEKTDELVVCENSSDGLDACEGAELVIVDLLATLEQPHKIAGYESFALAKMSHPTAKDVPLVLISPPEDYDLDSMVGWPGFVFGHVRRPVTWKIFRRISTWV